MKILIVRTFPNIINPHQYNVQEIGLAKALTRKGHECGIVLYNGKNRDSIEELEVSCYEGKRNIIIYWLYGLNIFKNGIFPSLNKIVKKYDVIQVHEYDQITSWWYYAYGKKPVVVYHGPYYHDFNKKYNLKCKIFDNTFLKLRHNRNVCCLTKSPLATDFLRRKGFQNVKTVGVGLDTENFQLNNNVDVDYSKNTFNLLYIGKIEERRNILFLLDIFAELISRHDDIRGIIVGKGDNNYQRIFLEKANTLIESNKLFYYSRLEQKDLDKIYRNSNIMIFTSQYEIFGMVLLESLFFNVPVISSKNGGASMLLSDDRNGYVIDNWDKDIWVGKIEELYKDQQKYRNIVDGMIEYNKDNIFWDSIVERFITEYQKII